MFRDHSERFFDIILRLLWLAPSFSPGGPKSDLEKKEHADGKAYPSLELLAGNR